VFTRYFKDTFGNSFDKIMLYSKILSQDVVHLNNLTMT